MAKLINGNGNPAVYAAEDSDWYAAIMGNTTAITGIGEQFRCDQADANTIEVFDGVIITQEGRRVQLDVNQVDLFEIPTGTQGDTNYYIIGYHLATDGDSNQYCETFVQKMEDGTETIPENTFRGGADDVYISLYRVTQDGLNIDSIDLLLPTVSSIYQLSTTLTALVERVGNGMKCKKFGIAQDYTVQVDISDLNLTSAEDYVVIIPSAGTTGNVQGYVSAKTATSFTITGSPYLPCPYQVLTFK